MSLRLRAAKYVAVTSTRGRRTPAYRRSVGGALPTRTRRRRRSMCGGQLTTPYRIRTDTPRKTADRKTAARKTAAPKVVAFGKLYSNHCGHCIAMVEAWDAVNQDINPMAPHSINIACENIEAGVIDAKLAELNQTYGTDVAVQGGYPTIFKIVQDNTGKKHVHYYNGSRSADAMKAWITTTA